MSLGTKDIINNIHVKHFYYFWIIPGGMTMGCSINIHSEAVSNSVRVLLDETTGQYNWSCLVSITIGTL